MQDHQFLKAAKGREIDSSQSLQPCRHLDFVTLCKTHFWTSDVQKDKVISLCCFKLVAIHYSSDKEIYTK